jgi:hypothetical protein
LETASPSASSLGSDSIARAMSAMEDMPAGGRGEGRGEERVGRGGERAGEGNGREVQRGAGADGTDACVAG